MRHFSTRADWRNWLLKNHDREKELWLVFYKKHTGRGGLRYGEALEEAICFGWIDGVLQRVDGECYRQRFTPRLPKSKWSEANLKHARRLIDAELMTAAGLAKLGDALRRYEERGIVHAPLRLDEATPELMAMIRAVPAASNNFAKLSPSLQRQYLGWVMSAKKEETRIRRMGVLIEVLASGRRLGLK